MLDTASHLLAEFVERGIGKVIESRSNYSQDARSCGPALTSKTFDPCQVA